MSETEKNIAERAVDVVRAGAEYVGVVGSRPTPRVLDDPRAQRWLKVPKQVNKKLTYYWLPKTWPQNIKALEGKYDGNWVPEPIFWMGFYADQVRILDEKITPIESDLKVFRDEIAAIQEAVSSSELKQSLEEADVADTQSEIGRISDQMKQLRDRGVLTTDTKYVMLERKLRTLQQGLTDATPRDEEKIHIADWPESPGSPVKKRQNLYILIRTYKSKIAIIEKTKLAPLKAERDLNDYWAKKWEATLKEKFKK